MVSKAPGPETIQYVGFNQDQDCFAVGTQEGFRIFNSIPFKGQFVRGKYLNEPEYEEIYDFLREWSTRKAIVIRSTTTALAKFTEKK